ncbi:pyridoxal-phosphate dependent enzyme [bacterium]|nr:pyridoxal-phosphate dependent enzyme [bacterium]
MSLHIKTPLLASRRLCPDRSVWLKLENTQPSGSFKARGIGYACQVYAKQGARRFVSSSGGNAGLAVAYAGRMLEVPVVVVVPETTTERAKELIRFENAEVVVHGSSWAEAHEEAMQRVDRESAYLHPFDDPYIWQGHATLVEELAEERGRPDAIVLSVGGGGLFCGVVEGLRRVGWSDVPLIAVETEGADSFAQALEANELIALESISSIATSLGAKQVAQEALNRAREHPTHPVVISDADAVGGCRQLLEAHHMLVEPACGAAITAALRSPLSDLIVIICGGVGVSDDLLRSWEKK